MRQIVSRNLHACNLKMLKYFRKLSEYRDIGIRVVVCFYLFIYVFRNAFPGRHNSATLEYGENGDVVDEMEQSSKQNSLRSTSSFCDEVFLEELFKASDGTEVLDNVDDDAISCGALSLDALNNAGLGGTAGVLNNAVAFMTDKGNFAHHITSRPSAVLRKEITESNLKHMKILQMIPE